MKKLLIKTKPFPPPGWNQDTFLLRKRAEEIIPNINILGITRGQYLKLAFIDINVCNINLNNKCHGCI
jgi:hypothetical protein